jgi:GT2 family glycosyltransferase
MGRRLNLVFVLPGAHFTDGFLSSWNKTLLHFVQKPGCEVHTCLAVSSNVTAVRNLAVGRDIFHGFDYDYCMWIDSDTIFEPDDIKKLLDADKDIISGLVPIDTDASVGVGWFKKDGFLGYLNQKNIPGDKPFEVGFAGFGFLLVRRGVFEKMGYPPFTMLSVDWEGKPIVYGEDVQWCLRAKDLGFKIWAHPGVMLGHQKTITLW